MDALYDQHSLSTVMPALGAGIHVLLQNDAKTWMAGTGPAMTTL